MGSCKISQLDAQPLHGAYALDSTDAVAVILRQREEMIPPQHRVRFEGGMKAPRVIAHRRQQVKSSVALEAEPASEESMASFEG